MSACKKSCCWTPFQVCATKKECGCHTSERPIYERLTFEEITRANAVLQLKGKRNC